MRTALLLLLAALAPLTAPAASASHDTCAGWDYFTSGAWVGQCSGVWVSPGPEFVCLRGTNGLHETEPVGVRAAVMSPAGCATGVLVTLP